MPPRPLEMPPLAWIKSVTATRSAPNCRKIWRPGSARAAAAARARRNPRRASEQRAPSEQRVGVADDAGLVDEIEHREQQRADREPEQIEEDQDAPREVVRDGSGGSRLRDFGRSTSTALRQTCREDSTRSRRRGAWSDALGRREGLASHFARFAGLRGGAFAGAAPSGPIRRPSVLRRST